MNAIFKKLNCKQEAVIHVVNPPDSFAPAIEEMRAVAEVKTGIPKAKGVMFALGFAVTKKDVDAFADAAAQASIGDAVIWAAYPKSSSKKYKCEFNRDTGWERFGANGFEPVRQVAIDEDWSALRFRRVEYIRTMKRGFAMTEAGKAKAAQAR